MAGSRVVTEFGEYWLYGDVETVVGDTLALSFTGQEADDTNISGTVVVADAMGIGLKLFETGEVIFINCDCFVDLDRRGCC